MSKRARPPTIRRCYSPGIRASPGGLEYESIRTIGDIIRAPTIHKTKMYKNPKISKKVYSYK